MLLPGGLDVNAVSTSFEFLLRMEQPSDEGHGARGGDCLGEQEHRSVDGRDPGEGVLGPDRVKIQGKLVSLVRRLLIEARLGRLPIGRRRDRIG